MSSSLGRRQVQTSATHPLVVDQIPAGDLAALPGRIGMCIAPGKKDLHGYTGAHDRDLHQDLETLFAQFPATVFVSLMEADEYARFGIAPLFAEVARRGARVVHYPIVDVSTPTQDDTFAALIERLYAWLQDGARVLVHCKGGFGRTGLVVAALLVRVGHPAAAAVRITRACRTGTIQTLAQERYVGHYAHVLGRT